MVLLYLFEHFWNSIHLEFLYMAYLMISQNLMFQFPLVYCLTFGVYCRSLTNLLGNLLLLKMFCTLKFVYLFLTIFLPSDFSYNYFQSYPPNFLTVNFLLKFDYKNL